MLETRSITLDSIARVFERLASGQLTGISASRVSRRPSLEIVERAILADAPGQASQLLLRRIVALSTSLPLSQRYGISPFEKTCAR